MTITVHLTSSLRPFAAGHPSVPTAGATLKEAVQHLDRAHKGLLQKVFDEKGNLRRHINLFVNDKEARLLLGLDTPMKDGDEITIIPSIAGGGPRGPGLQGGIFGRLT